MSRITSPIKHHGGKAYLATKIVSLMPPHLHYVEPYFGGGSVLLAKNPDGVSEVVNDIYGDLVNFWQVLASETLFARFQRVVEATPFSEAHWEAAGRPTTGEGEVERAVRYFVRCRQSLAGRGDSFAPLSRTRTRRNMNEQASAWLSAIEGLPEVHARLKRVVILNRPATDVIRSEDTADTLHYLDPPYLPETRASKDVYEHEMTRAQHVELLTTIRELKGKVMLSGYASTLYDTALHDWTRHEFPIKNHASGAKEKREMIEILWCNF